MAEATRLTRLGRLAEAMAVLRGNSETSPAETHADEPSGDGAVIDLNPPSAPDGVWTTPFSAGKSDVRPSAAPEARVRKSDGLTGFDLGSLGKAKPRIAAGARFEDSVFANASGSRAYKLYVPSSYKHEPLPLIVMLHGCSQSPDDFAAGTRMNELAEEFSFLVAYPAQSKSANISRCWNWFNAGDQQRDGGEPALIAGITRQVMGAYAVDASRVYAAGLSAGGAAAAILGMTHPDLFAAIGVHSGLASGAARDMSSAFSAMRQGGAPQVNNDVKGVPTIVFHGDSDTTVHAINAEHVIAQAKGSAKFSRYEDSGTSNGVAYRRTIHTNQNNEAVFEQWQLQGAGHAWSGGSAAGSYTDPKGPDASREMVRFFLQHRIAD